MRGGEPADCAKQQQRRPDIILVLFLVTFLAIALCIKWSYKSVDVALEMNAALDSQVDNMNCSLSSGPAYSALSDVDAKDDDTFWCDPHDASCAFKPKGSTFAIDGRCLLTRGWVGGRRSSPQ